jgi:hypothetical protein
MWKIKLILEGNLSHVLNDVRSGNPGWTECQPSGIVRIEFPFLGRDENGKDISYLLTMNGMREYNFFVEAMRGVGSGRTVVKGLWFLGKIPLSNTITGWVLKDKILRLNAVEGQEYSGTPTVGWKAGIIGDKVISEVRRVL